MFSKLQLILVNLSLLYPNVTGKIVNAQPVIALHQRYCAVAETSRYQWIFDENSHIRINIGLLKKKLVAFSEIISVMVASLRNH